MVWKRAECDEDDDRIPARWSVIGTQGAVPADGDVIGNGEFEGVAAQESAIANVSDPDAVVKEFKDAAPSDLGETLDATPDTSDAGFVLGGHC